MSRASSSVVRSVVLVVILITVGVMPVLAQESGNVPPLVRYAGAIVGGPEGPVAVRFAVYAEAVGGSPLWAETQVLAVDASGRFAVVLGATLPEGLPASVFAGGAARWLGVQPEGQAEQTRVALLSVPYAMSAGDAATVSGRPLSAFVLAGDKTGVGSDGLTYVDRRVLDRGLTSPTGGAATGSANFIPKWTDGVNFTNSVLYETGGNLGVNNMLPQVPFHVQSGAVPGSFFDVYSGVSALNALPVVQRAARGTPATPAALQAEDIIGGLAVRGYYGSGFSGGRGQVMFKAAENWTSSAQGTYLTFNTTSLGAAVNAERMRITPDGRVQVGIQPAPAGARMYISSPTYMHTALLAVSGTAYTKVGVSGEAIVGIADNDANAIAGKSFGTGAGIYATSTEGDALQADALTNTTAAVSATNYAVANFGKLAGPIAAVYGSGYSTGDHTYGYLGSKDYGVRAYHSDGVAFRADSSGTSVWAISNDGWGVDARSYASGKSGVIGVSQSSGGYGVSAANWTNGIWANLAGPTYAGDFFGNVRVQGNLQVTGTVSKAGGSFMIDHPLDPEHKTLSHSFVESPDMMNIYNGVVTLDDKGEAVVTLPDWFEALNGDFRYQLTSIGMFMPVFVADEVRNNAFRIAGGTAGKKVSWQVTGIRHDAFANENRIPVEQIKK
jgi:trimeric autotransporter adhesin